MNPLFRKPDHLRMDTIGVRLEQIGLYPVQSDVMVNAAYVCNGNDVCLYSGVNGLIRFKRTDMKRLGQELIELSEMWEG